MMLFAEIERDSAKHTFQSWSARYPNPYKQSKSTSPLYYSFDYGGKLSFPKETSLKAHRHLLRWCVWIHSIELSLLPS